MADINDSDSPKFLDVESEIATLIEGFRGGRIVRDLIPDAPSMPLNADYYFPNDNIIAELKCLNVEINDPKKLADRLFSVCEGLGYAPQETLLIALGERPIPQHVARKVINKSSNYIRKALRKANRQIRATKGELNIPYASGLVIIANENNTYHTPQEIFQIMFQELRSISDNHIDGLIYMTPNLYHQFEDDDVARSLWLTAYKHRNDELANFVDALGKAWGEHRKARDSVLAPSRTMNCPPMSMYSMRPIKLTDA